MLSDSQRMAIVDRLLRGRENAAEPIARRGSELAELPQSFGQEQLWFLDRLAPGLSAYNVPHVVRLTGPLDVAALGRAMDALVARHEAVRTRLLAGPGGRPVQVVDPPRHVAVGMVDLSGLPPDERQARFRRLVHTEANRPFALAEGPLLRARMARLAAAQHMLVVVVHHAVFDGWSAEVLVADLAALYRLEASGEPSGLAEPPVQFADYALWERERLRGSVLAELEGYWQRAMAGFPTVQFPTDRPRPALDSFDGALARHQTDRDLLDRLRELSRRQGATLFVTLLAGLLALLHRYTGQDDLVVGTVSANRGRPELTTVIGFLVNTLPVRADATGDPPFTELLARVQQATVGAYAHQNLPFGKLVQTLRVDRDPSRAPVFQIALTYAERNTAPVTAAGVEFVLAELVAPDAAKFDLTFVTEARDGGLWMECSYKTALFDAATIERLLAHYEVLLRGAVADPSTPLSKLPLLTEAELRRELIDWNDTAAVPPPGCVHQRFEATATAAPHAPAAEYAGQVLTYDQLNRRANQIARRLRGLGVGPESLVGVCMRTGLDRLAALLGIWKAGGGYVPLDPALPASRLSFMILDTAMPVVLADEPGAAALPAPAPATVVRLDEERAAISGLDGTDLTGTGVTPGNVAYVIYTSGSTGQPKGVVVEHRQALNFLHGMIDNWQIGPSDVVLQFGSFTFDASVMDMFTPLLGGARVVLAPPAILHSPPGLATLIRDRGVTFALLPRAVLGLLADEQFPQLRLLMTGGEELPPEVASRWVRPGLRFVNAYGPTEATVIATYQELDASMSPPPIGMPNRPNYQAYVLDARLNPVPVGVTGELHVGGAGVARGYLGRPELTRERFIPDPFSPRPGARLYKTGDLVRRRPDGVIMFAGRIDDQIKVHGLRVEPGEIEAALAAHPAIAQAVVTAISDRAGDRQLAAYLRPQPGASADPADLRAHLARTLPAYMIPSHFVTVGTFPLNASRKIDKAALPRPGRPEAAVHTPAATLVETMVAALFAKLLDREQVGACDSFFDLGGDSLGAMRLISMLDDELGVDIGAAAVFLAPTPRQLAALLRDEHGFADADLDEQGADVLAELPGQQPAARW